MRVLTGTFSTFFFLIEKKFSHQKYESPTVLITLVQVKNIYPTLSFAEDCSVGRL